MFKLKKRRIEELEKENNELRDQVSKLEARLFNYGGIIRNTAIYCGYDVDKDKMPENLKADILYVVLASDLYKDLDKLPSCYKWLLPKKEL